MADPVTLISVGSTLLSGAAGFLQSSYSAAVADANRQQNKLNAELATEVGLSDAADIGTENAGRIGLMTARMGASGIQIGSPSFRQGRARARQLNVQEQRRTVEAAYREAANYRTQANIDKAESSAYKTKSFLDLAGTALNVGGDLAAGSARAITRSDVYGTEGPLDLLRRKRYNYGYGFNTGF